MVITEGQVCVCNCCGHKWLPRKRNADGTYATPRACAHCKSPLWNKPNIVPSETTADMQNKKIESVSEVPIVPKRENVDSASSEGSKEQAERTKKVGVKSKLFSKFFTKTSPEYLLTILSPVRTISDQITFYVSQADLSFANSDPMMIAMSIAKVPSTSFRQFTFSPSFYTIERRGDAIFEFAINADQLLGTLNQMTTCQDVSIFSKGDGYLHIQQGERKFSLKQLRSKHVRPAASEFAYVAKLVAPTNFIQNLLADMDVLADRINIISTNNSQLLFTGVGDGNSGLVVEKILPAQMKEKGVDITFITTRKFQCTFDITMLKNIVDSVMTPVISLELSIDGPMKISSELDSATTSIYLANIMVEKDDEK